MRNALIKRERVAINILAASCHIYLSRTNRSSEMTELTYNHTLFNSLH